MLQGGGMPSVVALVSAGSWEQGAGSFGFSFRKL